MVGMIDHRPSDEIRSALFEQLAERLRQRGYEHPEAAAAALAARGDSGLDRAAFAASTGLTTSEIEKAESGMMDLADLRQHLGYSAVPKARRLGPD